MSDYEVHLYDTGTIVRATIKEEGIPIDLTDAEKITLLFRKKDRSTFKIDVEPWGDDPTTGQVFFLSTDTTFDIKGQWSIQAFIKYPDGSWHSNMETFTVYDNIVIAA
jgi:hypothetical protein